MAETVNFTSIVQNWQSSSNVAKLHWSGNFDEYLSLVKKNPKITRNSFQRMYDMIVDCGTEKYIDFKKEVVRYRFFDDTANNGKDAVFGLDIALMKLVNVLRAAALGYGTEKRVILLHGPVGSAKSTICRMLKKGPESYSKSDEGALYTFEWVDEKEELDGLFGKGVRAFQSPMHEEPLLLIPEEIRPQIADEINRGLDGDFRVKIEGELSPGAPSALVNAFARWFIQALAVGVGGFVIGWLAYSVVSGAGAIFRHAAVTKGAAQENETKACPFCAATIKREAVVCRYCGRDVLPAALNESPLSESATPTKSSASPEPAIGVGKLYGLVGQELARGIIYPQLQAQAMAISGGNESKARVQYIKLRIDMLKADLEDAAS